MVSSANQSSRSISPSSAHPATICSTSVGDGGGVAAHELVTEGLVVEHLPPALGRRVEDDPLAEDRGHERVGLRLVEDLLRGPEEELVGFGSGEQHHILLAEPEDPDVAALVPDPLHQCDRVDPELLEVAVLLFAARDPRRLSSVKHRGHGRTSSVLVVQFSVVQFVVQFVEQIGHGSVLPVAVR